MKITIRKKLIFSYLSLLIVPIVIVLLLVLLISSPFIKIPAYERLEKMDELQYAIGDIVQENVNAGHIKNVDLEIQNSSTPDTLNGLSLSVLKILFYTIAIMMKL